jgi:hypothetical protein
MSWRALFIFLLLAAVASWQGGIQLGEWLVARAPESISSAPGSKDSKEQVLDANGKPFTAQPPQPRIDGTLGVPRAAAHVEWTITPVIASLTDEGSIPMMVDSEGNYERRDSELAAGGAGLVGAQNDVATLDVASARVDTSGATSNASTRNAAGNPTQQTNRAGESTDPSRAAIVANLSWQQSLKKEIDQCSNLGFFQRPTCVQNARNKFCAPNNAWGRTADCPAREF